MKRDVSPAPGLKHLVPPCPQGFFREQDVGGLAGATQGDLYHAALAVPACEAVPLARSDVATALRRRVGGVAYPAHLLTCAGGLWQRWAVGSVVGERCARRGDGQEHPSRPTLGGDGHEVVLHVEAFGLLVLRVHDDAGTANERRGIDDSV